jgi:hypothetical protein
MMCSTSNPAHFIASAIMLRWQRHQTASAHMMAVGTAQAMLASSSSARENSSVSM